jgi:hypothetical protein
VCRITSTKPSVAKRNSAIITKDIHENTVRRLVLITDKMLVDIACGKRMKIAAKRIFPTGRRSVQDAGSAKIRTINPMDTRATKSSHGNRFRLSG